MDAELERHRCEVRQCIRMGFEPFREFIKGVKAKRGEEAAGRLWRDVREQAARGNKGEAGCWLASIEQPTEAPTA